jgi:hypothetical protein
LFENHAFAQGRESVKPIDFSKTPGDEVTTNISQLRARKDGLHELEDSLFRPLQSVAPKTSLDAIFVPPQRTIVVAPTQSKKAKELRDRQKNWAFADPNAPEKEETPQEALQVKEYGPDGKEKKKLTLVEQFYRRLERQRNGKSDSQDDNADDEDGTKSKSRDASVDDASSDDDSRSFLSNNRNSDDAKKKNSDQWQLSPIMTPLNSSGPLGDFFGSDNNTRSTPSPAQIEAQKSRMSDFQQILGIAPAASPNPVAPSSLSPITDPGRRPFGGLDTFGGLPKSGFEPQIGIINPAAGLSDPATRSFTLQPQPLTPVLRLDTPAQPNLTPPAPNFTAPVRKF